MKESNNRIVMDKITNIKIKENNYIDKFIKGDCLSIMKKMPDEYIDLIITSPPYNLKNSTGNGMKDGRGGKWQNAALVNGYSHYDDNMPLLHHFLWT
jgi:modification methylase